MLHFTSLPVYLSTCNTWNNYQSNWDLKDIIYVYYKNQEAKKASCNLLTIELDICAIFL